MPSIRYASVGLLLALCCSVASPAIGQQQLGAIQGTIADQTKGVLPGVTVTVTNLDTGMARTTRHDDDSGVYRVPSLDPGRYKVHGRASGLPHRRAERPDRVGRRDAWRQLHDADAGQVDETIRGQRRGAGHPDREGGHLGRRRAEEDQRPAARRPQRARRSPRCSRASTASRVDVRTSWSPSRAWASPPTACARAGNNAMVDGASINNGPWGGTMLIVPNVEAVQEFQVIANNPSAEYGRNAGATVSVITEGRHEHSSAAACSSSIATRTCARRASSRTASEARLPPQRLRWQRRRTDQERQHVLLLLLRGRAREEPANAVQRRRSKRSSSWTGSTPTRPELDAAQPLPRVAPSAYPTTDLRDLGGPLPGANVWSTTPDGIPDVGSISVINNGPRDGDQFNGRVRSGLPQRRDRLRGTYYLSNDRIARSCTSDPRSIIRIRSGTSC